MYFAPEFKSRRPDDLKRLKILLGDGVRKVGDYLPSRLAPFVGHRFERQARFFRSLRTRHEFIKILMSSRDQRFVAVHRGGLLDLKSHSTLALWAANCASGVLPLFEKTVKDARPRNAIFLGKAWAAGNVKTGAAMKGSLAAHAAARKAKDPIAKVAARAAGQAAATAHCADHSMGALLYVLKVYELRGMSFERVLKARIGKLPAKLRPMLSKGVLSRLSISARSKIRLRNIKEN